MSLSQQRESIKGLLINLNTKESRRSNKKGQNIDRFTAEELQFLQSQLIKDFFDQELQTSSHNIDISFINEQIAENIIKGQIKVPQKSKDISALIKPVQQQRLTKMTPQQMQMYEKEAKRLQHLKLISNLNKQLSNKQPKQDVTYIFTKEEHERRVRDIIEQKKRRQKINEEIKQALKQKLEREQKEAEQLLQQQKLQQKQRKRMDIEQKIMKKKQQHIHFLSLDIKHRKDLEQILNKVPLHEKMQNNFKQTIEMPQLQEKKQQYKKMREFKQRYSVDNIRQYEKEHDDWYQQMLNQSKFRRLADLSRVQEYMSQLPQKSERLKSILAQEIEKMKRKWNEKQAYVEEKLKRQQNYVKKLKEQHKPKIDKQKQEEILRRLIKQQQHLSKVGLEIDKKKVGLQYLGEVKKMLKKRTRETYSDSEPFNKKQQQKLQMQLPKLKRSRSQISRLAPIQITDFFEKLREQKIKKIMSSEEEPEKKFEKLKIQSEKIQQAKERKLGILRHNFNEIVSKQASSLALNSLKAKINLIELMKKK